MLSLLPDDTIPRWDLAPPLLCIHGLHGGHLLPSGPGHLARRSLHVLGPSLYSLQLPRVLHSHHLSYPLLRGLGVHYFTVTRYPGIWIVLPRTFIESPIIPALAADPRFRDSMRLVHRYSLLPFMTPRQFFYPRVVLKFYHTTTSRGVSNQMQLQFSIDGRLGILRASDITAALGLPVVLANFANYQQWPHPSPREMVRSLS